ncbi:MAG: ORF6N domain-containing protein [Candidatus Rokubacteria bacterium]|nr:ORF6N domain-containing protein [Candidatus Rokubacteria bacterium]
MAIDIHHTIFSARGKRVMLDADLARVYGLPTKALLQSVRRNIERFPDDFMFRLTRQELPDLRSQTVTSSGTDTWGGRRHLPYAFTEQGVAMLSSVLRSPRAIAANIAIMRAFVRARALLISYEELDAKVTALQKKYDAKFDMVFDAIRELMSPPAPTAPRAIGFRVKRGDVTTRGSARRRSHRTSAPAAPARSASKPRH